MKFTVVIPARYASSRFPGKPLADIGGKPMVVHVAERAAKSGAIQVIVATDDARIATAVDDHGYQVVMTRDDHESGTDRIAEVAAKLRLGAKDIVVNVQGDEPLMDPALVIAVADLLAQSTAASMSTAAHPIEDPAEFLNPNVVKVVLDADHRALYFSRAPIPWWRDGLGQEPGAMPNPKPLRHIGIYGYRVGFLRKFPTLSQAPLERIEALEQLRALWHGHSIAVHITPHPPGPGVDTPADLARVRQAFGA